MGISINTLLGELSGRLSLRLVCGEEGLERELSVPDINRPGLALTGFFDYFPAERLQVLGKTELEYWNTLSPKVRRERLAPLFAQKPAGFVVSHDMPVPEELVEIACPAGVPVIATPMATAGLVTQLTVYLEDKLAPSIIQHGTLVDVYGAGVLLLGESGIGKSETALALLDKGHRLCADDVVEIKRTSEGNLLGSGVQALRYHMEIRGLGIIDIRSLFGARAVREHKIIELVVFLGQRDPGKSYDRTGLDRRTHSILGVEVDMVELPIQSGKNIAVLVEVAAMSWRLRTMGINPAEALNGRILSDLSHHTGKRAGLDK